LQALDVGQFRTDTFTYRATDGNVLSNRATVTVTVQGRNDPPAAVNDTTTTNQDTRANIYVLANDTDPERHELELVSLAPADTGTVGTVTIKTDANGQAYAEYDPAGNFAYLNIGERTTDTFTYQVSDGHGGVSTGTVTVTIEGLNDPPQAVTDVWTAQIRNGPGSP
jgi:VCBS repeat-containing protein